MKVFSLLIFLGLLLLVSCNGSNKKADLYDYNTDHAVEGSAIKEAVDDAYRAICFKPGEQLNFDDIKKRFTPDAQLLNFRADSLEVMNIDQFVEFYKAYVTSNKVRSFYEEEIKGSTEQFGRIAQRMSTYKTYINTMDSLTERGVNSFQLIKTDQGWKVSSIIWDVERQGQKIPGYFLKPDSTQ